MKRIVSAIVTIVIGFGLAGSILATSETEEDDPEVLAEDAADKGDDAVTIVKTTLARDRGKGFEPVTKVSGADTFCVLVKLSEAMPGTRVKAVWIAIDAGRQKDKKIFEKEVTLDARTLKGVKEPGRIDFCYPHGNPYPTGKYKADIYLNGKKAETVPFKIE